MSGFSADWLDLREPLDSASRSLDLLEKLRSLNADPGMRRIVDLATGTGANLRYLAPHLGGDQDWLLIDRDPALLAELPTRVALWASTAGITHEARGDGLVLQGANLRCRVRWQVLDLAAELDRLDLPDQCLITASALLDLVSATWLGTLAARCRAARATALFALTYDGRMRGQPALPEDERVAELVNRHQRTDKGFGPALGPEAAHEASRLFGSLGYDVASARSDWRIGPGHTALQSGLVEGWAGAATEMAPQESALIEAWVRRRRALIDSGRSWFEVGHEDTIAWPR